MVLVMLLLLLIVLVHKHNMVVPTQVLLTTVQVLPMMTGPALTVLQIRDNPVALAQTIVETQILEQYNVTLLVVQVHLQIGLAAEVAEAVLSASYQTIA